MKSNYSIYEAKTHLSEIIRQVKLKRQVIITERGRPVARVVPLEPTQSLEDRFSELEMANIISPKPAVKPAGLRAVAKRSGSLSRFLQARD